MGGGKRTKFVEPPLVEEEPSPSPVAVERTEVEKAKKLVRKKQKRARGREANILAGRMMTQRANGLQDILGLR